MSNKVDYEQPPIGGTHFLQLEIGFWTVDNFFESGYEIRAENVDILGSPKPRFPNIGISFPGYRVIFFMFGG
ncbi:MAG: hypothetical protein LKK13_01715 [Bacilli bacterium]|nr:hypothetical protein [Bacilli bacterium]